MDIYISILISLHDAGVRFLISGGAAIFAYGHIRATSDLDLILPIDADNAQIAIIKLVSMGFRPRTLPLRGEDSKQAAWTYAKNLVTLSFQTSEAVPLEINVFYEEPDDFERLWSNRVLRSVQEVPLPLLDKESLIAWKLEVATKRDMQDVAALRALL